MNQRERDVVLRVVRNLESAIPVLPYINVAALIDGNMGLLREIAHETLAEVLEELFSRPGVRESAGIELMDRVLMAAGRRKAVE